MQEVVNNFSNMIAVFDVPSKLTLLELTFSEPKGHFSK
jgi:hypothetical protein